MSTTLSAFSFETVVAVTPTTLASTNTSQKAFIGNLTLTNTGASDVECYVWRLLTATTPTTGAGGNWIERITVPSNKTVRLSKLIGHTLNPSMSIKVQADTAAVINGDASGTIET